MSTLVLGTAQWGAHYGITNNVGRLSDETIAEIAELALISGISIVDTAAGYGDAERRLRPWAARFRIGTKVAGSVPAQIEWAIDQSLNRLDVGTLDSCLIHDWDGLEEFQREEAFQALLGLKQEGVLTSIGTSVYDSDGVASTIAIFGEDLGVIQVPANAIDRRLDENEMLIGLPSRNVRVQVRSVFLQGLLLDVGQASLRGHNCLKMFHAEATREGQSAAELAISHVRSLNWASELVVGTTTSSELAEIQRAVLEGKPCRAHASLACTDLELLDPRRWSQR